MRLHVRNDLPGIGLVPAAVELLGNGAELDNEVAGEILRLGLAAFLAPKLEQSNLVLAQNNPGIRAANESTANRLVFQAHDRLHIKLIIS